MDTCLAVGTTCPVVRIKEPKAVYLMAHSSSSVTGLLLPGLVAQPLDAAIASLRRHNARRQLKGAKKLHLACGKNVITGWSNLDIEARSNVVQVDLTQPLPVASDSVEQVYSEHFIEHIERDDALALLKEVHRSLCSGGMVRLSTPDLDVLVEHFRSDELDYWADVHWKPSSACRLLNEGMHWWGHRFLYNESELRKLLQEAGFSQITRVKWRDSAEPVFKNLECRPDHKELIFEAAKT
jgi:predicted SAM-dependent methyltransferase